MTRLNPARLALCVVCLLASPWTASLSAAERLTLNFNPDWRFIKDDPAGAQAPGFDDKTWAVVSAPHTYNDIDTFDNWSTPGHRGEQIQWSGRTWYRKTFTAPAAWKDKKVYIEFEAARQVAEVYLNGTLLGTAKTGFTPFGFDLTSHLKPGQANVLAVMVDNRFMRDPLDPATAAEIARLNGGAANPAGLSSAANPNLTTLHAEINKTIPEKLEDLQADQIPWNNPHWHPAHGGLYRNVRLIVTDPLHISLPLYSFLQTAGPYVYATEITPDAAKVSIEVPVENHRAKGETVEARVELFDASGHPVFSLNSSGTLAAGASTTLTLSGQVPKPRLWEPAYPYLYRVVCSLRVGGQTIDTAEIPVGLRAVRWDVAQGFFINGRHLKLHGWGQKPTNEWPGLGAALPDWLQDYTLQLMHDAGGNFIRWGHTAAGPAQIAAGDRLGLVADQPGVDGEADTVKAAWQLRVMAFRDLVIYFRNNPSILVWEGGNQKVSRDHARELRGLMDKYDPQGGRAYAHRRADQITAEFMDVGVGTEGGREIAKLPVFEGEYNREESPRRVWDNASPPNFGYPEAKGQTYQFTSEQFAANQVNHYMKKLGAADHSGGANWIFSDSTSGGRVAVEVDRAGGEVDGVRLPKEAYWVCAAMWRDDPQVHIIGHWTYPAATRKAVYVASNAESVELFLNGKSLGTGKVSDKYLFTFPEIGYEPGELKAVASTAGKTVATHVLRTAGAPVGLKLSAITAPGGLRADGSDVALIDVEVVDAQGNRCPTVQQRADFETSGPAVWRGGYNSGKINSVNNTYLDLEAGLNRVAVRATRTAGAITVRATSEGLKAGSVTITSQPFAVENGATTTAPAMLKVALPAQAPAYPAFTSASVVKKPATTTKGSALLGTFTKTLNYTGPSAAIVHLEIGAQNGKKIYVDRDYTFTDLPAALAGADWLQIADDDQRYSAVDLIEVAVTAGTVVTIAHDDRAPLPEWLTKQFQPTAQSLTVNGTPMKLFLRTVAQEASLTFGSNTEGAPVRANHYVVFVNTAPKP
jgi:beta-galactosidase